MKKFLTYIAVLVLFTLISMKLLDWTYTQVYKNGVSRNKLHYIYKMAPQRIDYVFLGSSRTANSIVATDVKEITGLRAQNFGVQGSSLADNLLQLKLLVARKVEMKKVIVQVDYIFNQEGITTIANQASLPLMQDRVIADFLQPRLKNFDLYRGIPFYRYMATDHALGFREFASTLVGKKARYDLEDGFIPFFPEAKLGEFEWPDKILTRNKSIDEMREICQKNNIELLFFCAPVCSNSDGSEFLAKLKTKIPELRDYSRSMPDEDFSNCGHLTPEGAKKFTKMITSDLLLSR